MPTYPLSPEEYTAHKGDCCPFCGSTSLEGLYAPNLHQGSASAIISCRTCLRDWKELYVLTGYETCDDETDYPN